MITTGARHHETRGHLQDAEVHPAIEGPQLAGISIPISLLAEAVAAQKQGHEGHRLPGDQIRCLGHPQGHRRAEGIGIVKPADHDAAPTPQADLAARHVADIAETRTEEGLDAEMIIFDH